MTSGSTEGPGVTVRINQSAVIRAACWLLVVGVFWRPPAHAQDNEVRSGMYTNGFDDPQKSWVVVPSPARPTVIQQRVSGGKVTHSGIAAEQFVFKSRQTVPDVRVSHTLPPSLLFDELTASVWVKATTASVRVELQVQFPHQIDPRTDQPLKGILPGDTYTTPGEWQQLKCRTTDAAVQDLVRKLRDQLRQQSDIVPIDQRTIIVEQIVLRFDVDTGETALQVDDLEFGPIAAPEAPAVDPLQPRRKPREQQVPATIGDDQLLIDGRPGIVLFAPYHGEEVDNFSKLRFNVAWIDRYDDAALLSALQASGLFAMANPLPQEIPLEEALQPIGLVSFTEATAPILFWYMGTRLTPAQFQTQEKLMEKVRAADGQFSRPILVDVTGSLREYHRHADMVGSSRHILNTSTSLRDYFEYLHGKRKWALPEKPVFTLIQTEVADANLITRSEGQSLPLVEPEQIWMQAYAALQAGYKGIGFWKMTSLTGTSPGNEERRHAISLFNAHVQLLEPWLASAKFVRCVPATVGSTKQPRPDRDRKGKGQFDRIANGFRTQPDEHDAPSDVQVALFNCDQGLLLLPLWYERNAQFQPGRMSADELSFVVTIGRENVQAWEVTTTSVTPLPSGVKPEAGGMRIRLSKFDQFTAIVLTQGQAPIRDLQQRLQALQADCAREWIDLASAKYERVADVNGKLAPLAPSIPNANFWMSNARQLIETAEKQLAAPDFDGARRSSRSALQLMRIVQRGHWENAVASAKLTSGVSSPHTICFQTLPDHWQLVAEIGQRPEANENLLRSGDFEDSSTITASGWDHRQGSDARVRPGAELYGRGAAEGDFCLRLLAESVDPSRPPEEVTDPPERFVSPPMSVYAGQIVHISGKIQVVTPLTGNTDGLMIYESTKGTVGALRWKDATPAKQWQPFQLIREIDRSQDLTVTIELRGLGEVRIDDLKVVPIKPKQ
jgi:hypothetical protein